MFLRVVFGWLAATAARQGLRQPRCGAVTAIQRFGSALNLNLHFHALVFDGVYTLRISAIVITQIAPS